MFPEPPVVTIAIDRPHVLNALDSASRMALIDAFTAASRDPRNRAIVLTGAGSRAFTVGQDINEVENLEADAWHRWMSTWVALYESIARVPLPTVAVLNGVAVGAGLQLGLLCDLRVACTDARVGLREIEVGLPAVTGHWLLSSMLGRSRATELVLTGRLIDAQEALAIGLIHHAVPREEALRTGKAIASRMAILPQAVVRATRRLIADATMPQLRDASDAAIRNQVEALASGEPQRLMARFFADRSRDRRLTTDS